jgi:mono/diheme cytochrome c family protein
MAQRRRLAAVAFLATIFAPALLLTSCVATKSRDHSGTEATQRSADGSDLTANGFSLFRRNCAHCHGDDATGDEGPDLHGIGRSDEWLGRRIRKGIKGEMPAFEEKFNDTDIDGLIAFLRSLH